MGARAAATSPRFVVCKKHGDRGTHAGGSQNPRASSNQSHRTASARLRPDSGRGGQIVGGGFGACDADGEYEKKINDSFFFKKIFYNNKKNSCNLNFRYILNNFFFIFLLGRSPGIGTASRARPRIFH